MAGEGLDFMTSGMVKPATKGTYDFLTEEEERRRKAKLLAADKGALPEDTSTPSGSDVTGFVNNAGGVINAGNSGVVTQSAVSGAASGAALGASIGAAGAASGAASGAAAGSAGGPIGAVIGAVVGLTAGLLSGNAQAKKAKREARLAATNQFYKQQAENQQRLAEGTTNQFSQLMRNYSQIV